MASNHKSNISFSSWLLTILLIAAVTAVIFVLSDIADSLPPAQQTDSSTLPEATIDSNDQLANKLLQQFIRDNIRAEEKNDTLQAINNTLQHLQDNNDMPALHALQKLELTTAIEHLSNAVQNEENLRSAAKTWIDIGNLQQLQSPQLALYAYKKSSKLDDSNINAWNRLGHYYRQHHQYTLAENAYSKVLQLSGEATATQAVAQANFGLLYQAQGKMEEAEASYLKALHINTEQKNTASIASNSENLAIIYKRNNDFVNSEKYYQESLSQYQALNQKDNIATIESALASLYHKNQQLEKAKLHYQQALSLYQEDNNQAKTANLYSNLGIIYQQQNHATEAQDLFNKSLAINESINQQKGIADQYGNLGILLRGQKSFAESEASHLKSLKIYQQLEQVEGISQQQTNLGFLYQAWGKSDKACDYWLQSQATLEQNHNTQRAQRIAALIQQHCPTHATPSIPVKSSN